MSGLSLVLLFFALLLDRYVGDPDWLWRKIPHPVVLFGKAVSFAERHLNKPGDSDAIRYRKGAAAFVGLIFLAGLAGLLIAGFLARLGPMGLIFEIAIVAVLIAQKSLADHVRAVSDGLRDDGLNGGRRAVAMIVGRDPSQLDRSGVCRAAIESLAENFSDGVVAPAFWYAVFGLPGLFVYKMINTADSMIGYRSERYLWFGRVAAQTDDMANWLPARLSAFLIAAGSAFAFGVGRGRRSIEIAFRDAGLHPSPNAGWPEAAMAGGADLALGGPRAYPEIIVQQAHLNASGKTEIDRTDIDDCLGIYDRASLSLIGLIAIFGLAVLI